ncbi:unnamed protein product, partial [Rotaria magnacalcarata]
MSESIKLKNLLKKIKPSIQLEVRKKKPTSTAEFLEYDKEVEELFQLSNIIVDNNNNNNSNTCKYQQFPITSNYSLSTNSNSNLPNISSTKFSSGDYRNSNNNRNSYINRNIRYNPVSSSFTPNSFHSPQYSQTRTNNYNQRFQQNRYRPSYTTNSYNNNQKYTPAYQNNSSYNNNKQQPCSANTVFPTDSPADTNIEEESLSPSFFAESSKDGVDSGKNNKNPLKSSLIFITTLVNNHKTKILIDTGATTTFINQNILHHMAGSKNNCKQPYSFVLADGAAPFEVLGTVELAIKFSNSITHINGHIARNLCTDMIIGMDYINKYNLNINVKKQIVSIDYKNHIY